MSTKIEWAQETWNPITGCNSISEGCANCYAKKMANRLRGRYGYDKDEPFKITLHPNRFYDLDKWKKSKMIFVCSMGDLFHEDVPARWIDLVIEAAEVHPQHTFLFLTKRPRRMEHWTFPDNAWVGVTVENQRRANERIPVLLKISAKVRFVSVEPMLEPVLLTPWLWREQYGGTLRKSGMLDWVICGAETGSGARYMDPAWASALHDQCRFADVPFFFKKASKGDGLLNLQLPKQYPIKKEA